MALPISGSHMPAHSLFTTGLEAVSGSHAATADPAKFKDAAEAAKQLSSSPHQAVADASKAYGQRIELLTKDVDDLTADFSQKSGNHGSAFRAEKFALHLDAAGKAHRDFIKMLQGDVFRTIPLEGTAGLTKFQRLHFAHEESFKALNAKLNFLTAGMKEKSAETGAAAPTNGSKLDEHIASAAASIRKLAKRHQSEFDGVVKFGNDLAHDTRTAVPADSNAAKAERTWKEWAKEGVNPGVLVLALFSGIQAVSLIVMAYTQRQVAKQKPSVDKPHQDDGLAVESEGLNRRSLQNGNAPGSQQIPSPSQLAAGGNPLYSGAPANWASPN